MLSRLQVRNFVLIDSLEIDFPEGLVIITGQTGAGKSILLGALSLLMGSKADAQMVSEGAENCVVEAEFDTDPSDESMRALLEENDVECIKSRRSQSAHPTLKSQHPTVRKLKPHTFANIRILKTKNMAHIGMEKRIEPVILKPFVLGISVRMSRIQEVFRLEFRELMKYTNPRV